MAPIRKLLVANRGEIAIRVFRACEGLGIATVAVYASDDAGSLHVRAGAEAVEIESYFSIDEHIRAALLTGADAIHPGYGFHSESAQFSRTVATAGLTFVGPPPEALAAGADKLAAKRAASAAGVPVLPTGSPEEIGYPLIVKASAGGGGRGMRIVRRPEDLDKAMAAARREAGAAFGDDTVFCERFVERPRHVEVQLLADSHGHVVALGERDCSVQRRHQKVVEEAPSPAVDPELRSRLNAAAIACARAVGYVNAGTAEFMLDGKDFYFLELNGRIQVEHPVTELVTGIDLVRTQIEIAAGVSIAGLEPTVTGHAMEARVYAEDPRLFLPEVGRLDVLRLPTAVRVDAGVAEGDPVGVTYDPMIAKLIAHGPTRDDARARLQAALDETVIEGVVTNLPFLRWLVRHPVFRAGEATVAFLDEHPPLSPLPFPGTTQPPGPGWRLNLPPAERRTAPSTDGGAAAGNRSSPNSKVVASIPGTVLDVYVTAGDEAAAGQPLVLLTAMKMEMVVTAPWACVVTGVLVEPSQTVARGQELVVVDPLPAPA